MKQPFIALTLQDVEILRKRRCSISTSVGCITYPFTLSDIINAQTHLQELYPSENYAKLKKKVFRKKQK